MARIRISWPRGTATAELRSTPTTAALLAALPCESRANTWGDEVYFELPLAVPTVMGGIRTAAINIVATATIAPLAGILTLGDFILARNVYGDAGVLAGAILVALMALACEGVLAGLQWKLTPRSLRDGRVS